MNDLIKNPTEIEVFKPNANQEKWLDTALFLMSDEISEISRTCGIDRTTWYAWVKIPGFIEWFKQSWDHRLSAHAWKLDAIGLRNAKRDHKYWQDMQRRVGNLWESKGETTQQTNVQINVTRGE